MAWRRRPAPATAARAAAGGATAARAAAPRRRRGGSRSADKPKMQNQNFEFLKIALNRVLTLPDYRTRCTDHFAGSGSKIENKTYPWWQNTENIEFRSQCHILRFYIHRYAFRMYAFRIS